MTLQGHWQDRLDDLLGEHGVVGAALGLLQDGTTSCWAAGSLNLTEGIEARPDSLFQIGSITKVWTATLVLQLADEGLVDLDAPVTEQVSDLVLDDPGVTPRQLLDHSSGIDGDHFLDTGRGDDCLERYAVSLATRRQLHPAGVTMSYCNAGFSLLGRLIEVADGRTWDEALRARLLGPLGLHRSWTLPEDVLRFRTATGHLHPPGERPRPTPQWSLPRSAGPAGLLCQDVAELLALARLHLDDGLGPDGTRLVSAEAVAAMRTPSVTIPDPLLGEEVGLGWLLRSRDGRRFLGHTGNTIGQSAYLVVVPDASTAVALLTSSEGHPGFASAVLDELLAEVTGLSPAPARVPVGDHVEDPDRYAGTFTSSGGTLAVGVDGGRLLAELRPAGTTDPVDSVELLPYDGDTLLAGFPAHDTYLPVTFYEADGARYLHTQGRAWPRSET